MADDAALIRCHLQSTEPEAVTDRTGKKPTLAGRLQKCQVRRLRDHEVLVEIAVGETDLEHGRELVVPDGLDDRARNLTTLHPRLPPRAAARPPAGITASMPKAV